MATKITVVGAAGRMGRTIIQCICEGVVPDVKLVGAVEREDCADLGKDAGSVAGCGECGVAITKDLEQAARGADVLVDFSFHTVTAEHSRRAGELGRAMVVGTTGLSDDEKGVVQRAAEKIPIVMAPNMSLGMNVLFSVAGQVARALKDRGYDVEIIERHHRHKKDSPSGTAVRLGEAVAEGLGWSLSRVAVHGRQGLAPGDRPVEQIGFHAVRGGDVVGDHTVVFASEGECVELSHRATSRNAFAMGALRAAAWVAGKKPGLYSMQDVLGL